MLHVNILLRGYHSPCTFFRNKVAPSLGHEVANGPNPDGIQTPHYLNPKMDMVSTANNANGAIVDVASCSAQWPENSQW